MMRRRGQRSDSVGQLGQRRRDTRPSAVGERRARRSSPPPHAAGGRPSESRPGKGSYALPAHPQGERGSMSYKSREKKRRARIAQLSGRREQRAKFADRHYLTIVSRRACCNRCGGSLREGAECVYRHTPREILCVLCADDKKIHYRPSMRWERLQRRRKSKRAALAHGRPDSASARSRNQSERYIRSSMWSFQRL
jgi:hypothetical protein